MKRLLLKYLFLLLSLSSVAQGIDIGIPFQKNQSLAKFNPSNYGTVLTWLKNGTGITLNAGNVSNWADQSGNGNDAIETSAANQPFYNTTGLNSFPTLDFDGNNDFLTFGTSLGKPANFTVIIIFKIPDISISNSYLCGCFSGDVNGLWGTIGVSPGGVSGTIRSHNSNSGGFSADNSNSALIANNTPAIFTVKYSLLCLV